MDPETVATNSSRKIIPIIAATLLLAIIIVGVGYAAYVRFFDTTDSSITTYAECVQAVGSEMTGENTCVTANGQTFTLSATPDGTQPVLVESSPIPVITLIAECPQEWIIEMEQTDPPAGLITPGAEGAGQGTYYIQSNEYLVVQGQRRTRAEMDIDWVGQNCDVRPQTVLR